MAKENNYVTDFSVTYPLYVPVHKIQFCFRSSAVEAVNDRCVLRTKIPQFYCILWQWSIHNCV